VSAGSERAFGPVLRELGQGLSMSLPARTRILRELESDLQDLTAQLIEEGVEVGEARRRAEEALVPDRQVVSALGRIHETGYRRATRRWPADRVLRLERRALVLCTGALLLVQGGLLVSTDLLAYASPFLWPVLVLGSISAALALWKAFELWVKRDHAGMRRGVDGLLGLSVVTMTVGASGVVLDLRRLAATVEATPELLGSILPFWLIRDAGLLAASLVLALGGGLAWFVFRQWIVHVETAHQELVGSCTTGKPGTGTETRTHTERPIHTHQGVDR